MWQLARGGAWAHRGGLAGTAVTFALAGALLGVSGVLVLTGLNGQDQTGQLSALGASFAGTVAMVVILVVSSTVSLALRGRQLDFALLRAVGATRRQVRRLVSTEVLFVALGTVPLGAIPGTAAAGLLTPLLHSEGVLPHDVHLSFGPLPVVGAVLFLLPVAWVAGRLASRETLRASPTAAVRESVTERRSISTSRKIGAASLAGMGLLVAGSPLAVAGTLGSASAGASAYLLIGAAALAGPVLVHWLLRWVRQPRSVPATLALVNTRAFAHRLTTVVVPLALALAAGTTQTTVDRTVTIAAQHQLTEGLRGVLVAPGAADAAALRRLPGVTSVAAWSSVPAQVRTDSEDVPGLSKLSWESTAVRVVDGLIDPGVTDGSLAGLGRPDTVAVSQDAKLQVGGVGSNVKIRFNGTETTVEVVAVYDRGLGFGDYVVGPATVRANQLNPHQDAVLVRADPGASAAIMALTAALTASSYATQATVSDDGRQLSLVLLLALLGFVVLAAANTLVMTTARRRDELLLLGRTGATGRQQVAMVAFEAALIGLTAWLIGTVALVPAVIGVSAGLLGAAVPPVDLTTYGALSLLVLVLPALTVIPTARYLVFRRGHATAAARVRSTARSGGLGM